MLTDIARAEAPDRIIEHAWCMPPLNDYGGTGRFDKERREKSDRRKSADPDEMF